MIEKKFSVLRILKFVLANEIIQYINTHDKLEFLPYKIRSLALYYLHSVSHSFCVDIYYGAKRLMRKILDKL